MNIAHALERVLDFVLPRRARTARTEERALGDIPISPASCEMLGMKITTLMEYREQAVEDLIRALKYDGSARAAQLCADILADFLREEIAAARQFSARRVVLVPVPLHRGRARERGFNQMELVLRRLPPEFRDGTLSCLAPRALARAKATKQQTRLPRDERIKNVAGAFELSDAESVKDAHVFVIDDVVTTGATLANAAKPFVSCGTMTTALALARA